MSGLYFFTFLCLCVLHIQLCICTGVINVFTPLNATAFITFKLAEGDGAYSRAAFIISAQSYSINFTFASSHGAGGGYFDAARSVRKGIAAAAHHDAKREKLYLLDETFIISALS